MYQYTPSSHGLINECKLCNNVQIPNLPLKGPKPFDQILGYIYRSIIDEATAIDFYSRLMRDAPNKFQKEFIEHVYNDELEHLQVFSKLFCYYTDIIIPPYKVEPVCFSSYKEGLIEALRGELRAVEFYKNVQLSTMDQLIIDTYFMVMVDEQSHATIFGTLYGACS